MKRLFILASAAIVAFASCAKTEVVYNEAPQEIGFKAVTGMMTKADDAPTLAGHTTMGVFADRNGGTYFDNTSFTYDTDAWTAGTNAKYWPLDGTLDFTVYAPYDDSNVSYANTEKKLSINADNCATDWLYGTTQFSGRKASTPVTVTLNHALSLVEVNVTGNTASLKKVELLSTYQAGSGTVTYGTSTVVAWDVTDQETTESLVLYNSNSSEGEVLSTTALSGNHLVIPTTTLTNEAIRLTYTLPGYDVNDDDVDDDLVYTTNTTATNDLGTSWAHGKKYVYNISISPNEIKFTPKVNDWVTNDFDPTNNTNDDPKVIEL